MRKDEGNLLLMVWLSSAENEKKYFFLINKMSKKGYVN